MSGLAGADGDAGSPAYRGAGSGALASPLYCAVYEVPSGWFQSARATDCDGGERRAASRPNSPNGSVCPIRRASSASGSLPDVFPEPRAGGGSLARYGRWLWSSAIRSPVTQLAPASVLYDPRGRGPNGRDLSHLIRRANPEQCETRGSNCDDPPHP